MGEHRVSSGPPGRQSLTFSADETREDGSTIRTLETPAATIRFCFIDNVSSDSDSEETADNWKPQDVTPMFTSSGTNEVGKDTGQTRVGGSYILDSHNSCGNNVKDGSNLTTLSFEKTENNATRDNSEIDEQKVVKNTEGDCVSSQVDEVFKADLPDLPEKEIVLTNEHVFETQSAVKDSSQGNTHPVDERFKDSLVKEEIAFNHGFVKERSSSPDKKSLSDHQSIETCSSSGSCSTSSNTPSMPRSPRFNPFDHDVFVEEDHFSDHGLLLRGNPELPRHSLPSVKRRARANSEDYPRSISSDDSGFLVKDDNDITFADLGLAEDHFSQPEGFFGLSTTEELELAIESCKEMIMETGDNLERKKNLVGKLVQLRIRLQEAKEGSQEVTLDADTKLVLGHKFMKKETGRSKHYCEKCNNVIWGVLQVWYRCSECGFCCHGKCLNLITRMCASVKVLESPTYILNICPEKGLASQQYRCSECRTVISFKSSYDEPRQCDYTGNYYCEQCHWNDTIVIPARVLHNWDFEPMKVCRASKQFLKLMTQRSVLRIQDVNPMLFSFIEELNEVKKLREEILVMKKYFLSCQDALASKLLLQLQDRQHFVDNSDIYSMQDLLDIANDDLVPKLTKIHASFAQHIKADCELCQVKGFICELCDSQEILFPFDNHAILCSQCSAVLHRHCYMRRGNSCPRCERRNKRATEES